MGRGLGSRVWGGGAEGLKDFGEVVFSFRGGVAKGDCALKLFAGFGHALETGKDGSKGLVEAGIVGIVVEGDLKYRCGFVEMAALDEERGKLAGDGDGVWVGIEAAAKGLNSLIGFAAARVGEGQVDGLCGGSLGLNAGLVEQVNDRCVVGIVDQIGGERVQRRGGLGIECEGRAPFGFGGDSVMG